MHHQIYSLLHDTLPLVKRLHYNRLFYYPQLAFQKGWIPQFQMGESECVALATDYFVKQIPLGQCNALGFPQVAGGCKSGIMQNGLCKRRELADATGSKAHSARQSSFVAFDAYARDILTSTQIRRNDLLIPIH